MIDTPLPRHAYFGANPNDVATLLTSRARKTKLDNVFDAEKKFRLSLVELRSLDETGLTEAGALQARLRLTDLVRRATDLLDDLDEVAGRLRALEAEESPLPTDAPAASLTFQAPTPRDVAKTATARTVTAPAGGWPWNGKGAI